MRRTQPPTHHRLLLLPLQVRALALTLTLTLTLTRYEAYGVGGVGLIVNCLSDNNNRATMEVRTHYPRQSVSQAATTTPSQSVSQSATTTLSAGRPRPTLT